MNKLFGIRTKLFGLVLTGFIILIGGTYWQIGQKAQSVAETVIDRSLTQSSSILETRIDSRFRFIQEIANGIARDGRVLPLVFDEDSATLQDQSSEFKAAYEFDILFFLNADGQILARSDNPNAIGVNLAGKSSLFDEALRGKITTGFIVSDGKLMQTVVVPVFDNVVKDLVRGAVVVSYELSRATADEIVVLTESEIGFFVFTRDDRGIFNGVEKSYMTNDGLAQNLLAHFDQDEASWNDILENTARDFRKDFVVGDQIQHSVILPIISKDGTRLGFVVAMRSSEKLIQPFEDIQQSLLLVGIIGLIAASFLAMMMALGLSRPIIRLVDITKQIEEGNYPKFTLIRHPRDEIGVLKNALLRMGNNLREKAELEDFLADIANEGDEQLTTLTKNAIHFDKAEDENTVMRDSDKTVVVQGKASEHDKPDQTENVVDGRYKLLKPLGSGGIGQVFMALDQELDEKIAIKIMRSNVIDDVEGLNFKEEIRLARKITHRNIVRTYDFGSWQHSYYITMEFVQGVGLNDFIAKQKNSLDINVGVGICKQICSAVMAAHQMGIIHRDLKPSNMIINRRGILQVMDFGLAMQVNTSGQSKESENIVMGTPKYMAPEQFLGSKDLDERSDIYSLGAVMFSLFSGKPPFPGKDLAELAEKHMNSPIPNIERNPPLPPQLQGIIFKALAKEPKNRFQSVRELLTDLNRLELN
jgi:HAMP domain-containing protein